MTTVIAGPKRRRYRLRWKTIGYLAQVAGMLFGLVWASSIVMLCLDLKEPKPSGEPTQRIVTTPYNVPLSPMVQPVSPSPSAIPPLPR
ncbi:hypothetical protein OHB26_23730 [Nocardia sp. NBC_01503]|uniref:hypothetical protein n=1 Tax=Nocardia sp. NBC_01503 TaxID=2975997 RepID=UPI002E7B8133|nr:hypothetical protein [Nocardia sp. NBC_01503]WTL29968.1 hypothetical protein OHB26_23730 [Nocardia sp. NBC_01503]